MIDWLLKRSRYLKSLKVQIRSIDLDNKLDKLEKRLNKRIDVILVEALGKIQIPKVQISPNKNKSKTSLRQTQENKVIQVFRRSKKQLAIKKIEELKGVMPIPSIKDKLIKDLGISKASFYNYLKEVDNIPKVQIRKVQISPKKKSSNKSKI